MIHDAGNSRRANVPVASALIGIALVAAPWYGVAAQVATTPPATPQDGNTLQPPEESFDMLDADRDGYVAKDEVPADSTLQTQFDTLDANDDDRLSRSEYDSRN